MSRPICNYLFSALLVLAAGSAFSQETGQASDSTETVKHPKDTVKRLQPPTGIRFGTDLITLVKSQSKHFDGWELNTDVDFGRYYLAVDYGNWARTDSVVVRPLPAPIVTFNGPQPVTVVYPSTTKGKYENSGSYFRIGVDINFLLKDPDKNMFFVGARYGHASYSENLRYTYSDDYYGTILKTLSENSLHGHWFELTTGLRVKIVSGFWMGYTARLKFAPRVKGGSGELKPFEMPGYGLVESTPYWGFNYQIFWRVPFRKAK